MSSIYRNDVSKEEIDRLYMENLPNFKDDTAATYSHLVLHYNISPMLIMKEGSQVDFSRQTLYNRMNAEQSGDGIRKAVFFYFLFKSLFLCFKGKTIQYL
jgi:hypothetical protein